MYQYRVRSVNEFDSPERLSREWFATAGIHGLQCGSGANFMAACLNVDGAAIIDAEGRETPMGRVSLCDDAYCYLRCDAARRLPIDDACVEWVYAEHFIEHLEPKQAIAWLTEVRRVLLPGGLLRVSTPDLAKYIGAYTDAGDGFFETHRQRLQAIGMQQVARRRAWMMNQIFYFWGHRWLYDLEELTYAAAAAGFPSHLVAQVGFRQGRIPDVAGFDLDVRNDESFYVEITKPGACDPPRPEGAP